MPTVVVVLGDDAGGSGGKGGCERPHDAELMHRFELAAGPYPGERKLAARAENTCLRQVRKLLDKRPSPVPLDTWHVEPTRDTWALGDRLVLCYVTSATEGRKLRRSVLPG